MKSERDYLRQMMNLGFALGSGVGIPEAKAELGLPTTKADERLLKDIVSSGTIPLAELDDPHDAPVEPGCTIVPEAREFDPVELERFDGTLQGDHQ